MRNWSSNLPEFEHQCTGLERDPVTGYLISVHQHVGGGWWWYDETWADEFGPFDTEAEATENVKAYAREYLR